MSSPDLSTVYLLEDYVEIVYLKTYNRQTFAAR